MTRLQAVTVIQNRLGQRTAASVATQIVSELQLAQADWANEATLPWFLIKVVSEAETTSPIAVETDFIRELQEISGLAIVVDGVRTPLERNDYDFLSIQTGLQTSAKPTFYSLIGTNYYFFAAPDASYTVNKIYYAREPVLSADGIENKWLIYAPGLMISIAGERVARYLRDPEAVGLFVQDIQVYRKQLIDADAAHRSSALVAVMGG
jgi:hypothetical protein